MKKTIIIGLGKTGLSCVRYLTSKNKDVVIIDTRKNPPGLEELHVEFSDVPYYLGGLHEEVLAQAREIIISPGISLKEPAIAHQRQKGISVLGDIELFAREARAPIVAITGSNGKSTVTTLVGEMAKNAGLVVGVGGNLGTPALDLLAIPDVQLFVLELSSFQLETTYSLKASAAVVLNISPDHLDRYQNMEEYIAAKMHIYDGCKTAIINRDESFYVNFSRHSQAVSFGLSTPKENEFGLQGRYLMYGSQQLIAREELLIKGDHQVANALAALALGKSIGLPMPVMINTLRDFPGLIHRCQWIKTIDGVAWFNDSKGTNIGATRAAIAGLGNSIVGKIILIAGGQGKNADFTELFPVIEKYVRTLILIGEDAKKISIALQGATEIIFADSMSQAVQVAKEKARINDVVLLSPACASFDMFKNFEHRGEVFIRLVNEL